MASSLNQVATNNTITWTSSAQICNVYNGSKTVKIGTGAQSGSSYSSTIPASYMNSSAGPQTYEIKCYDPTAYPASDLTADTDPHTGWQAYPANLGAPTCATGTSWNGTACVAPSGNLQANPTTCTIAIGASSCSTNLSWTTANAIGTEA